MHRRAFASNAWALLALLTITHAIEGQATCPSGNRAVPQLGIERFECITDLTCEINRQTPGGPAHRFSTEPTVWGIDPNGPSAGQLRDGDAIVAVDGSLITSTEAGRQLANLRAGSVITLRIRRGSTELTARVVPALACMTTKLVVGTPGRGGRDRPVTSPRLPLDDVDALERRARARAAEPRVDFGMEVSCDDCGWRLANDTLVFDALTTPTVSLVRAGGPAAAAGVRVGDVLLEVNGAPFASRKAGRTLGALRPGDAVTFRVRRGSETRTITLVPRAPITLRSF